MARRAREVRRFREELLDELLTGAGPAEVVAVKQPSGALVPASGSSPVAETSTVPCTPSAAARIS